MQGLAVSARAPPCARAACAGASHSRNALRFALAPHRGAGVAAVRRLADTAVGHTRGPCERVRVDSCRPQGVLSSQRSGSPRDLKRGSAELLVRVASSSCKPTPALQAQRCSASAPPHRRWRIREDTRGPAGQLRSGPSRFLLQERPCPGWSLSQRGCANGPGPMSALDVSRAGLLGHGPASRRWAPASLAAPWRDCPRLLRREAACLARCAAWPH